MRGRAVYTLTVFKTPFLDNRPKELGVKQNQMVCDRFLTHKILVHQDSFIPCPIELSFFLSQYCQITMQVENMIEGLRTLICALPCRHPWLTIMVNGRFSISLSPGFVRAAYVSYALVFRELFQHSSDNLLLLPSPRHHCR